jgi:hypothetical protein
MVAIRHIENVAAESSVGENNGGINSVAWRGNGVANGVIGAA